MGLEFRVGDLGLRGFPRELGAVFVSGSAGLYRSNLNGCGEIYKRRSSHDEGT